MSGKPAALFAACVLLSAAATAQDILFYRFDEAFGTKVVNYAPSGTPAPNQGTITSSLAGAPASSWVPGRLGTGALAGSVATPNTPNRLDTGWIPGTVTGSLTYALWLNLAYAQPGPSLCYVFGSPTGGAFRAFCGAGGLFTGGLVGSSPATVANIYQMASQGWVHVAFVADATAMTCQYYVNGVAEPPRPITAAPTWTSPVPFTVGQQLTTTAGSIFHIDEFLLTQRAMTAGEIMTLAMSSRAGDGGYGSGCGAMTLASTGGVPAVGNLGYTLQVSSATPGICFLAFGSNRAAFNAFALPFDVGTFLGYGPCLLDCSADMATVFAVVSGTAQFPLAVPPVAGLGGLTIYAQAPGLVGGSNFQMTNAFAIGVGM